MPRSEQVEVRDMAIRCRDEAKNLAVVDDTTFIAAGEMLKRIKEVRDRINAIFDPIVAAAHAAHKVALGQKKEVEKFYVEADKHLRGEVVEYKRIQDEARSREAAALARTGEMALPREEVKVDGVGFVKRWAFEVIDPDALPREYTMPDEVKIRKVVEALGESATNSIQGIRVWSYNAPSVRG